MRLTCLLSLSVAALAVAGCANKQPDDTGLDTGATDGETGTLPGDTDTTVDEGSDTSLPQYECDQAGWPQVIVDGGPAFETVQDALVAAGEGSDVLICDGTYQGPIVIERSVSIRTEKGPDATRIQGGGGPAIQVRADDVSITGLTLTGGDGLEWDVGGEDPVRAGGGLYAASLDGLTLEDCVIGGNIADYGGGLAASAVTGLTLRRVTISENAATVAGGGLYLLDSALSVEAGAVSANGAIFGGGAAVSGGSASFGDAAAVTDNTAEEDGGGVLALDGAVLTFAGGSLSDNRAEIGGGLMVNRGGAVLLSAGLAITGNIATTWGGGVYIDSAPSVQIQGVRVESNSADFGGGLFLSDLTADLIESAVARNGADTSGGGIYGLTSTVNIEGGEVSENWLAEPETEEGTPCGAGLVSQSSVFSIFEGAALSGNISPVYGGAACLVGGDLVMDRGDILNNSAQWGGGMWLQDTSYASLTDAVVVGNAASEGGGGAYLHITGAVLLSTTTDWGSDAQDNTPDDVNVFGATYGDYAAGSSFACDVALNGCN